MRSEMAPAPVDSPGGISVILCCHNSRRRLTETLKALSGQIVSPSLGWEIVLVDNASTDGTAGFVRWLWQGLASDTEFRIVAEPRAGLANARNKGIREAKYGFVLFCDDDNWLSPNYVQTTYDILSASENTAACGGMGIPHFGAPEPSWFAAYAEAFATGPQIADRSSGKILSLYGAGLGVNKIAWRRFVESGYRPRMSGRRGGELSSSEDIEMTNAFVLMGYDLVYSEKLSFRHFLPPERLTKTYLSTLFVAFGKDGVYRNLLYSQLTTRWTHRLLRYWPIHLFMALCRLIKYLLLPPKASGRSLYLQWSLAYISSLVTSWKSYPEMVGNIRKLRQAATDIELPRAISFSHFVTSQ